MKNNHLIEHIYESGMKFLIPLSPEEVYVNIVDEAKKLVQADGGSIYIKKKEKLMKVYATHPLLYQLHGRTRGGLTHKIYAKNKPQIFSKGRKPVAQKIFVMLGFHSAIAIPISYGSESLGVLYLYSKKNNFFSSDHAKILKLFCSMAFLSIRRTQLYSEVKQALETRDLFISMASHELKTPLTSINLYAGLLQSKLHEYHIPEAKWTDLLTQDITRLGRLINELLQVNLIKVKKMTCEQKVCNLVDIIKRSLLTFKVSHPFHTVEFVNESGTEVLSVVGDFDKLLQVFTNLLNNAAKFSPAGSPIIIRLTKEEKEVSVWVEDKGKGIAQKDLPNIFDQYYKGKNSHNEGMGLGLFITKNIIEEHKGRVTVESHLGKGTVVRVDLPEGVSL